MRVYLDTGIFIDYLSAPGNMSSRLRNSSRRGRAVAQICADAEQLFKIVSQRHQGLTSCLTYYEVEEALYAELAGSAKGVPHADKFRIPAARSLMTQAQILIKAFGITALDLTPEIVHLQLQTVELQMHGVRAADALHIATAMQFEADLIVSADEGILNLNNLLTGRSGRVLQCVDSDQALNLL